MTTWKPVTIEYRGQSRVIPPERVTALIDAIEEHVTLFTLASGNPPMGKLSQAYSVLLTYAGFKNPPTRDEIYRDLFSGGEGAARAAEYVGALLMLMTPPDDGEPAEAKKKSTKARRKTSD